MAGSGRMRRRHPPISRKADYQLPIVCTKAHAISAVEWRRKPSRKAHLGAMMARQKAHTGHHEASTRCRVSPLGELKKQMLLRLLAAVCDIAGSQSCTGCGRARCPKAALRNQPSGERWSDEAFSLAWRLARPPAQTP